MAVSGQQIVDEAKRFLGDPYVYGAAGPSSFDCSGLVQYTLKQLGISAPRTSEQQWSWSQHITQSQLQPGDLIFEQWPGDNSPPGHVLIYAGSGQVVEAPHTGANVQVRSWSPGETTIVGYGRPQGMPAATAPAAGGTATAADAGFFGLSWPSSITDAFTTLEKIFTAVTWWINPVNWVRIVCGLIGTLLFGFGLVFLVKAA